MPKKVRPRSLVLPISTVAVIPGGQDVGLIQQANGTVNFYRKEICVATAA